MANLNDFNADDYVDNYEPLPAGEYPVIISASEMKTSKKGDQYLALTVDVVDGAFKGRKVFANLNIHNSNEDAKKIAKVALADICRAVGVLHPKDSSELHNKVLVAKISIRPETESFPASNDVKRWMPAARVAKPAPRPMDTVESEAPKAAAGRKPWEK